jgi:hypothetical protein
MIYSTVICGVSMKLEARFFAMWMLSVDVSGFKSRVKKPRKNPGKDKRCEMYVGVLPFILSAGNKAKQFLCMPAAHLCCCTVWDKVHT